MNEYHSLIRNHYHAAGHFLYVILSIMATLEVVGALASLRR
jgi:hypothetical protein